MLVDNKALYVRIYDQLYKKIKRGAYQMGEKMPSEVELSKEYEVGRSTIREALLLLRENGLIFNVQGAGNYVAENSDLVTKGLERLLPIPQSYSRENLDFEVFERKFEIITEYTSELLQIKPGTLILSHYTKFLLKDEIVAYSLYMIPVDFLSEHVDDLSDNEEIDYFVFNLHKHATRSNAHLVMTKSGKFFKERFNISTGTDILLIDEIYLNERGVAIASLRHSMLPHYFRFEIERL